MPERIPSREARQAIFCACVVGKATGATEVTSRRIVAAVVGTTEVQTACTNAGISAATVARSVDLDGGESYVEVLESVVRSLAASGIQFGSRNHTDSVQPLPISKGTRAAIMAVNEAVEATGRGLNAVDVLYAVLTSDAAVAQELERHGLTSQALAKYSGYEAPPDSPHSA